MISTRILISSIVLFSVVQCIICLDNTGTRTGATKPNKQAFITNSKPNSSEEEATTEDISAKNSVTSCVQSFFTKPVNIIWEPLKGVLQSTLNTAANVFIPQAMTSKPLKNVT